MLSRIKELKQLYILEELPENKIYPIQKALDEIRRLQQVSINNNPTIWDTESNPSVAKICYLNTRSLVNKFDNIILDSSLQQSDVLALAETWIPEKTDMCNKFKLKNYMSHLNCSGRGKGLAIFHKPESNPITDHNEKDINTNLYLLLEI